jgi:Domain of unknown function (DUF4268)
LEARRVEIEGEIGEALQWNPYPDKLDKVILLDRPADLNDRSNWEEYASWLVERVDRLRKAFGPQVEELNLSAAESASAPPLPQPLS